MPSSLPFSFAAISRDALLLLVLASASPTASSSSHRHAFHSAPRRVKLKPHSTRRHPPTSRNDDIALHCRSPRGTFCRWRRAALCRSRWHATPFVGRLHPSNDDDGTVPNFLDAQPDAADTSADKDESGWVSNFGKYLLPPSWSLSLSRNASPPSTTTTTATTKTPAMRKQIDPTDVDVSAYDPNSRETADPIFIEGSTFPKPDAAVEECSVIDVECYVDEDEDEPNDEETASSSASASSHALANGSAAVAEQSRTKVSNRLLGVIGRVRERWKRNTAEKENEKSISKDPEDIGVFSLPDSQLPFAEGSQFNASSSSSSSSVNYTTFISDIENASDSAPDSQGQAVFDNILTTQSAADGIPKRPKRSRRSNKTSNPPPPPIFHSLETNDIDTATQFKQKKWQRRRKRAAMLLATLKNAAFLFVLTFLAGNVMNQFVDLTEDGSFEVHFGKSLSASPSSPPSLATRTVEKVDGGERRDASRPARSTSTTTRRDARAPTAGPVSRAVRRVGPAVVRVETETEVRHPDGGDASGDEEENERGDVFDGVPEAPPQSADDSRTIDFGQGSGMIIRRDDRFWILTNAHVVDGATRVYVLLTDGRRFKAELCGSDDIVDVAVLRIVPDDDGGVDGSDLVLDLPVAELGDSDRLEVGQFVTAIGSPGGLDNSCTIGIVSGLKRCPKVVGIPDKAGVLQYIQTDAAINQGNSGGPLVDVESGDIVGINTCIRANMEGTSFAIPINKVMGILDDLYEGKHITHGYLGVQMATMNPTLARYYNKLQERSELKIPEKDGVMIEKVFKKSPAEVGGLKKYDFVCEIDGQRVSNADDAHLIIDQAPIGKDLCITLLRGDSEVTVQVKPEDLSIRLKQLREERLKRKKTKA